MGVGGALIAGELAGLLGGGVTLLRRRVTFGTFGTFPKAVVGTLTKSTPPLRLWITALWNGGLCEERDALVGLVEEQPSQRGADRIDGDAGVLKGGEDHDDLLLSERCSFKENETRDRIVDGQTQVDAALARDVEGLDEADHLLVGSTLEV